MVVSSGTQTSHPHIVRMVCLTSPGPQVISGHGGQVSGGASVVGALTHSGHPHMVRGMMTTSSGAQVTFAHGLHTHIVQPSGPGSGWALGMQSIMMSVQSIGGVYS